MNPLLEYITKQQGLKEAQKEKAKAGSGKSPFALEIERRIKLELDTRSIIEGEAGLGKSYAALRFGEMFDPKFTDDPEGAVQNQVVFSAKEYLFAVTVLPPFSVLIYDEPGQSMHHREFMSEANIIISKTMIGYRFKRFISFLCIPNINLLDPDARRLVAFLINVTAHGKCEVFKQIPQKFGGDPWFKTVIDKQHLRMPGVRLRHLYEKKKAEVQEKLYASYHKVLSEKEAPHLSNTDLMEKILTNPERYQKDGNYHVPTIMGDFDIGRERARGLKAKLELKSQDSPD